MSYCVFFHIMLFYVRSGQEAEPIVSSKMSSRHRRPPSPQKSKVWIAIADNECHKLH